MALVTFSVGGRPYELTCRDGEEEHLRRLAGTVDAKMKEAGRALANMNEARQLLLTALLLADEMAEKRAAPPAPAPIPAGDPTEGLAEALETLAARVESLADALEMTGEPS